MTLTIVSIGQACYLLQANPLRLTAAAKRLGIGPALIIDGVPYYDEQDLAAIAEALGTKQRQK